MWTLKQLRQWAETGNGVAAISISEMRELVEDIAKECARMYDEGKNEAKMLYERQHPYRDGFREGWRCVIRKMRDHLARRSSPCSETDAMSKLLDELELENDVPEAEPKTREIPNGSVEVLLNLEERMRELDKRMLDMIEPRLKMLESIKLDDTFKTYSNFERRLNELVYDLVSALKRIDVLDKSADTWVRQHNVMVGEIESLEAAMRGHNEQVGEFENRMNEAMKKAWLRVNERLEYLERQEKLTLGCFEEQDGKIKNLQNEQVKLQNWRERISKA